MTDPYEMLCRFEAEHGTFNEILDRHCSTLEPQFSREHAVTARLLAKYNQIIWYCMGYSRGLKDRDGNT